MRTNRTLAVRPTADLLSEDEDEDEAQSLLDDDIEHDASFGTDRKREAALAGAG